MPVVVILDKMFKFLSSFFPTTLILPFFQIIFRFNVSLSRGFPAITNVLNFSKIIDNDLIEQTLLKRDKLY